MDSEIIEGARWVELARHEDARGVATVFDTAELPFPMVRYFLIEAGPGHVRAEHASSSHELLACIRGRVTGDLDNGSARESVTLMSGERGLWIEPGVWLRLHSFAAGTIVGVAANLTYAETEQWPTPNRVPFRGWK